MNDNPAIIERTHALLQSGDSLYLARESGLYRLRGHQPPRNLFNAWQPDQPIQTLAVAAGPGQSGAELILAGINGGVVRSDDGGETWQPVALRSPAPMVTCLALSPAWQSDGCALAGSYEDGIFRTSDGGKSFSAFNFGLFDHSVLSLCFAADGLAFAGVSTGLYISENGGRLWRDSQLPSGDETLLCLAPSPDFAADATFYAGTENHGILRSGDGGRSWAALAGPEGAVNALIAYARGVGNGGLAALVNDGVWLRAESENWRQIAAGDIHAMALDHGGAALILAAADGGIRRHHLDE